MMKGICEDLCPQQETNLRVKEKLLHFYEYKNGQKNVPGILVKSFSRSAAGVRAPKSKDLRSERCLHKTIDYLLKDIILDKRKLYNFVYDFIFDRLRAVRQEIVMQNFNALQSIKLLEPMIMFLAYSRYRLCEESIDNFDRKICEQHLQECLKRVLCCYDEIAETELNLQQIKNRHYIEALYQVFNLGSTEALRRGLTQSKETKENKVFQLAYAVAVHYHQGNFYRVLNGIEQLPHILGAVASLKVQLIRRNMYEIFAHAYNSKQLTVPLEFLCRLTKQSNVQDVINDCQYYNLKITADRKGAHFFKGDFNANAVVLKSKHEQFVEEKLKAIYLSEVLLLKRL